jgi:hypothetical protein
MRIVLLLLHGGCLAVLLGRFQRTLWVDGMTVVDGFGETCLEKREQDRRGISRTTAGRDWSIRRR